MDDNSVIPGSGVPIAPRQLDTVISLRFPSPLAAALRDAANARGITISDLLRNAAQRIVSTPIGWQCEHMNMTSMPGVLGRPTSWCGCEMDPVFEPRELRSA